MHRSIHGDKNKLDDPASSAIVIHGRAEQELRRIPAGSIAATITSPPYFQQKDYKVDGQIGWELSVHDYVRVMTEILQQLWRVATSSGSCFVVVGDTYLDKSLQLVPQRLAIAAVGCGWTVRNDLIWAKSDAAPDGAADRWRFSHEHILFLTKRARGYKFNADQIRVPYSPVTQRRWANGQKYGGNKANAPSGPLGQRFKKGKTFKLNPKGTIPRDVLEYSTARSPFDHFATFPIGLIEKLLLATTDSGDRVLDPFAGTATTGVAAVGNGRRFVGIELNPDYVKIARSRLSTAAKASRLVA